MSKDDIKDLIHMLRRFSYKVQPRNPSWREQRHVAVSLDNTSDLPKLGMYMGRHLHTDKLDTLQTSKVYVEIWNDASVVVHFVDLPWPRGVR